MSSLGKRLLVFGVLWRLLAPESRPRFPPGQVHPLRIPGRSVFVGDREFFVREAGPTGGTTVVLVHGLGNDSLENWYELISTLQHRYRIVSVDLRNHGKSDRPRERFEIARMADEVAGVMDAVGVGRAVVAGFSMGGMVTQELAHRHPHRVEKMVLMGTSAHHPAPWGLVRWVGFVAGRALERLTGKELSRFTYWYMVKTGAVPGRFARWFWETSLDRDADLYYEAGFAVVGFDSRPWLGGLDVPALVVVSARDQLVPASWQRELAYRLRDARQLELPDGRHEHPWTHAVQIAEAIAVFVDGTAG